MRKIIVFALTLIIALSSVYAFSPAIGNDSEGSATRNVLLELFTATWCSGCPFADAAAEALKADYGERVSLLQYHIWDDGFDTPATDARAEQYNAADTNIPALWVDGVESKFGAQSESEAYNSYKSLLEKRLAVDSPLELEITSANISAGYINVRVNLSAIDSIPQSAFNLRIAIYENKLLYDEPKPDTTYNYVVRDIAERSINASSLPLILAANLEFNASWNYSNMGAVVFAQIGDSGEVLQSHSISFGIEDEDNDGLPDEWEMLRLGTLLYSSDDDPDGDGYTNMQEYLNHTDPLKKDVTVDSIAGYVLAGLGGALILIVALAAALARWRRKGRIEREEEEDEESE